MRVRVLGGIDVADEAGEAVPISASKQRALLAVLGLAAGRPEPRSAIIDALWPEDPPETAQNLVQGYVSDLRKTVGSERILTESGGYRLDIDPNDVDALEFEGRARSALRRTDEPVSQRFADLDEVLELWRGPLLGDLELDGPLAAARQRLEEVHMSVVEHHLDAQLDLSPDEVISRAEHLLVEHRFRERLWVSLAVALYRTGRQRDALDRLHEARMALVEELGVDPGPSLVEVERQILAHDAALLAPAAAATAEPSAPPSPVAIVGRDDELARLANRLGAVGSGNQHAVFIGGEPGIGKTTLARAVATVAGDQGFVVIAGRCDEHVAVPYGPFVDALADHLRILGPDRARDLLAPRVAEAVRVVPQLAALMGIDHDGRAGAGPEPSLLDRFEIYRWMLGRVQRDTTLLIVLEDVHWADSASLRLLHYLISGGRLPDSLIVATHRTTEAAELLADILADLRSAPAVERLVVHGLDAEGVAQLVQKMDPGLEPIGDLAGWAHELTDGNPFLVGELLEHVIATGRRDGVPDSIADVVGRRIRRLSPECGPLLRHAAILGESVPLELLRGLTRHLPDVHAALREAVDRGILVALETGDGYRFSHAIIRSAITAEMTVLELEDLHLGAARAWQESPESDQAMLEAATHYLHAGTAAPVGTAIDAFERAGSDADREGAKVEAIQWYDRALKLLDPDDPRHRRLRLTRFVTAQAAWHWLHGDHVAGTGDTG